jgi:hypothetical protein
MISDGSGASELIADGLEPQRRQLVRFERCKGLFVIAIESNDDRSQRPPGTAVYCSNFSCAGGGKQDPWVLLVGEEFLPQADTLTFFHRNTRLEADEIGTEHGDSGYVTGIANDLFRAAF